MPVLQTTKPAWLAGLHEDIIKSTLPYFDWSYGVEALWSTDHLPPRLRAEGKRNLKKFGSPMIDRVFRPHITLTSFGDHRVARKISLEFDRLLFDVTEIAI
jgi:hypothetical protein